MSITDQDFETYLAKRRAESGLRRARAFTPVGDGAWVELDGRRLINFSSNDYLGLARHPALAERAVDWAQAYGTGAGASRLVCGTTPLHRQVETKLAALKGVEAAMVFGTGFQANATVIAALLSGDIGHGKPLVFSDRLIHASMHHGIQASKHRQIRFRHNDVGHLESLLEKHADHVGPRFIFTESVFSMDGDRADLPRLADLAERYSAFLYVDEAHATGVLGPHGTGLAADLPGGSVSLVMGTFSKALGGFGAYVAGSKALIAYLENRCSGFIYSTAPPPAVLGAMDAALDLVPSLDAQRQFLAEKAQRVRDALTDHGLDSLQSSTQIVPIVMGSAEAAVTAATLLEDAGVLGIAIRPPTVPDGSARIRLALSALHTDEDLARLIATFPKLAELKACD